MAFKHSDIDEADLPSRYVLRKLTADEERAFEEHFVDCPECLDRLAHESRFREGLAAVDAASDVRSESRVGFWGRVTDRRVLARVAVVLLCTGLAAALVQIVLLRDELARSRRETAALEDRYAADRRAADLVRQSQNQTEQPAPRPNEAIPPTTFTNTPIIALSIVRSASLENRASVQFVVPAEAPVVVLLLEIPDVPYAAYRATLMTADGQTLRRDEKLTVTRPGELGVAVPTPLLTPRDYSLLLEGQRLTDQYVTVGRYRFQVLPRR